MPTDVPSLSRRMEIEMTEASIGDAEVPWEYGGFEAEYEALRQSAGVIDLSAAGLVEVTGPGASALVQRLFARDVTYLYHESSVMGLFLDESGRIVDLATVYRVDEGYWIETAIGNGSRLGEHLARHAGPDASVRDLRGEQAVVVVEGPEARHAIDRIVTEPVSKLPFKGVRASRLESGEPAMITRTGFTGEFGFKVLCRHEQAVEVWERLCKFGTPAGHRALEVAMCEVRQPLLHRELVDDPTVATAGFNWLIDADKTDYLGRAAVVHEFENPPDRLTVCVVTDAGDVDPGTPLVTADGRDVGETVFGCWSPGVARTCGIARVEREIAVAGLTLGLATADGVVPIETVSSPMNVPKSWGLSAQEVGAQEVTDAQPE